MAYKSEYFITTTNGDRVYFSENDWAVALSQTWTRATDGYAKRYHEKAVNGKRLRWVDYFHRMVMNPNKDEIIDHINQDRLDNRRENLRVASKSLNAINSSKSRGKTSKYRGVFFNKRVGKFTARIKVDGKAKHLGFFSDEKLAGEAYLKAQKEATRVV